MIMKPKRQPSRTRAPARTSALDRTLAPQPRPDPYPRRRAKLRRSDGQQTTLMSEAHYLRVTLEDGAEFDVELFQRPEAGTSPPRLIIRSPTGMLMVMPEASNSIAVAERPRK